MGEGGPQKQTIENLRNAAELIRKNKLIAELTGVIIDNSTEGNSDICHTKIDAWAASLFEANTKFEKDKNVVVEALAVAERIYAEMREFAEKFLQVPPEQMSEDNLLSKHESTSRLADDLKEIIDDEDDDSTIH